ncbi:hypothetical protein EDC14_1008129 [Hydrogenispora ethanolica]|uniref:Uncharacterized protein n=1 Tax=Hydrogenispora ethanolica TaxID=1082276 RepID=A0A4R1RWV2_HYDET|nr:hypothetical protein EDC14_1008129 [Hydrogenispora ethanolica]
MVKTFQRKTMMPKNWFVSPTPQTSKPPRSLPARGSRVPSVSFHNSCATTQGNRVTSLLNRVTLHGYHASSLIHSATSHSYCATSLIHSASLHSYCASSLIHSATSHSYCAISLIHSASSHSYRASSPINSATHSAAARALSSTDGSAILSSGLLFRYFERNLIQSKFLREKEISIFPFL